MLLALTLTHEGALVLALTIVATTALRGMRDASFRARAGALIAVLMVWVAVKLLLPPGNYFAGVLVTAALHFFDPATFEVNIFLLLWLRRWPVMALPSSSCPGLCQAKRISGRPRS